jgi:hypothetical protein
LIAETQLADPRSSDNPFSLHAKIILHDSSHTSINGTYLLQWVSPTTWREEISTPNFSQIRFGAEGGIWEVRDPAYLSLPMWQLMQALGFYDRLALLQEEHPGKTKFDKTNGRFLRCVKVEKAGGLFRKLCFDNNSAELASERPGWIDRTYDFSEYTSIGTKRFPRAIKVYEGKNETAEFSVDELRGMDQQESSSLQKPAAAQWQAWCPNPVGGIRLTPNYDRAASAASRTTARPDVIIYGAIGTDGAWHDLHILQSAGGTIDALILEAIQKERSIPNTCNGKPIVVETVFRR